MFIFRLFVSTGCLLAGTAAFAGEIDSDGVGVGTSKVTMHEVAEGHMLMKLDTNYTDFTFDTADHPMTGMAGPCFGTVEMAANAVSGGGKCLYTDADGEKLTLDWMASGRNEDGAMTGTWKISGGTGKWSEATGNGTFASLTDPETGESENRTTGKLVMP